MLAKLANNESVLKEYKYSNKKVGKDVTENTLTVTNKRIISESSGKNGIVRKEIPIKAAEYVTTQFGMSNGSLIGVILFAIIAVALMIIGGVEEINILIYIGAVFIVFCILAIIVFFMKRKTSVTVVISGLYPENNLMNLASSTVTARSMRRKKVKIKVNREVAGTMVNEIGALIINAKESEIEEELDEE